MAGDEFCVVILGNMEDGQQIIEKVKEENEIFNRSSDKNIMWNCQQDARL